MAVDEKGLDTGVLSLSQAAVKPYLFINRELSLVQYNERVLDEALDERNPLLERVKFLSISHSMLDEFFMIRVSGIREQVKAGVSDRSPDGMTPAEEMRAIRSAVLSLLDKQATFFRERLKPELDRSGIRLLDHDELGPEQKKAISEYFERMVFPVCTPLAVDPGHPFPHISNLSLNLAVELQAPSGMRHFARVKVPNVLPRLVPLTIAPDKSPAEGQKQAAGKRTNGQSRPKDQPVEASRPSPPRSTFVWLEAVLTANLHALFPQMQLLEVHPFRVLRDADLEIQELEAADLLETVEESLSRRRFGSAVALFVNPTMPPRILDLLTRNLELDPDDVYVVGGPLGLSDLSDLGRLDRPELKDPPFTPRTPPALKKVQAGSSIFSAIRERDILLHHPFDSFTPVVDFIKAAAHDEHVLAIKQTLYRVGSHSPIVGALLEAAEAGKQVAVLVELKARFDEENNIEWARALEQAGVHVTYGLIGLKTHCKVALVVRKEGEGIRRYVHLGTGNYNPSTARGYTDLGLLTCHPDFGADASELFNYLTGYSKQTRYRKLLVAPIALRAGVLALIEREIRQHKEHGGGHLIFKMNALVDPATIEALYRASRAGVKVDLLVRGICCLRPGIPRVSENIRVVSIIGRFLEHTRIYYFRNDGKEEVFIGSADMMPRNLDNRVETLFPIEDEGIKNALINDLLAVYLRDNYKARELQAEGTYARLAPPEGGPVIDAQAWLLSQATGEQADLTVNLSDLPSKYRKYLTRYGRVDPHE